ncbi:MAG: hypothetical protein U1F49_20955 [Rubrivivax sp.]
MMVRNERYMLVNMPQRPLPRWRWPASRARRPPRRAAVLGVLAALTLANWRR